MRRRGSTPGEDERFIEIERTVRRRVVSFSDDDGARYAALWDWVGEHMPDEPHWYLDHIAVDAEQRGKGGRPGLDRCRTLPREG